MGKLAGATEEDRLLLEQNTTNLISERENGAACVAQPLSHADRDYSGSSYWGRP
jgi:hypothetical protein